MAIAAATAAVAANAIRRAASSMLTAETWTKVDALVSEIDDAIAAGDDDQVGRLAANLEILRHTTGSVKVTGSVVGAVSATPAEIDPAAGPELAPRSDTTAEPETAAEADGTAGFAIGAGTGSVAGSDAGERTAPASPAALQPATATATVRVEHQPPPVQSDRRGRKRRVVAAVLAVIVGLALLFLVFSLLSGSDDDPGGGNDITTTMETIPGGGDDGDPGTTADGPTRFPGETSNAEIRLADAGDLQIDLTWAGLADLDLVVVEPDGTAVQVENPGPTETGAQFTDDANARCVDTGTGPHEGVDWPLGGANAGQYRIYVVGYEVDDCGSGDYQVTIRSGDEETRRQGAVVDGEEDQVVLEALPAPGAPTSQPGTGPAGTGGASGGPTPSGTSPPGSRPPSTGPDARSNDSDRPSLVLGIVLAVVLTGAALVVVVRILRGRGTPAEGPGPEPVTNPVAPPRLPAPTELAERLNHTIHRLGVADL